MRVYLPATLPVLRQALAEGGLSPAPWPAHAVTPALRASAAPDADLEELEWQAAAAASGESLAMLSEATPGAPPVRVVLSADVPEAAVRERAAGLAPSAVEVLAVVPWRDVAAVHLDDPGDAASRSAVEAALGALLAAEGSADGEPALTAALERALDALEDHALLWFAPDEVPAVVGTG